MKTCTQSKSTVLGSINISYKKKERKKEQCEEGRKRGKKEGRRKQRRSGKKKWGGEGNIC